MCVEVILAHTPTGSLELWESVGGNWSKLHTDRRLVLDHGNQTQSGM